MDRAESRSAVPEGAVGGGLKSIANSLAYRGTPGWLHGESREVSNVLDATRLVDYGLHHHHFDLAWMVRGFLGRRY